MKSSRSLATHTLTLFFLFLPFIVYTFTVQEFLFIMVVLPLQFILLQARIYFFFGVVILPFTIYTFASKDYIYFL